MTENIMEKMAELALCKRSLEAEKEAFERNHAPLTERIKALEEEIKAAVLTIGETIKTDEISAIWNKGKTTWDGRLLEGYAVAHPEILKAQKVGQPTVSFKLIRK